MGIKLDFTGLFVDVFIVSLVVIAIGIAIRSSSPRSAIAIAVIVIGAILALITGVSLVGEPIANWFHQRNNRIYTEDLSEDRTIQGLQLPRGATVGWRGKLMTDIYPAQPLTILGVVFERQVTFANRFTENDRLAATDVETGTLVTDQWIDGVPCQAHKRVEFFATTGGGDKGRAANVRLGKLKACTASTNFDFAGNRYLGGVAVTLNSSGAMEQGVLAADQDVDGHWCKQGTEVGRADKLANRFTLARGEAISGVACKAGAEVRLDAQGGHLVSGVLARDQQIGDLPCTGGELVGFRGDAPYPIDACVISRPVTMLGLAWPAGSELKGISGFLLEVTLPRGAAAIQIGEAKIAGRCEVSFTKDPTVLRTAAVLKGETGYAELHGMRFTELNINDNLVWGVVAEAATLDGKAYAPGSFIRLRDGHPE